MPRPRRARLNANSGPVFLPRFAFITAVACRDEGGGARGTFMATPAPRYTYDWRKRNAPGCPGAERFDFLAICPIRWRNERGDGHEGVRRRLETNDRAIAAAGPEVKP
jgi:hypothetical protein